ncbi:MAG: glycosyltransferase family 4 protein [Sandaracinaceae bacterium]|nr:glycosyltransferase family 4 protein [Sandaracinaceae bacterium]MDW8247241.1 glycosyltransferase family 4 protein [Sandaracinaceae bacterium]
MKRKIRVLWFGVARSPYNDFLFSRLSQKYDFVAIFQKISIQTHPWKLEKPPYRELYIRKHWPQVLSLIPWADVTVMAAWNDPLYVALIPFLKSPKAFWTDTPNPAKRPLLKRELRKLVISWVLNHFDQVWGTGKPGVEMLIRLGAKKEKTVEFPFFVDLEPFLQVTEQMKNEAKILKEKWAKDQTVFLGAGQLASKKRYGDAIRALALMKSQNSVLWLAGAGPEEQHLKNLARILGVSERVVFMGWLQPREMEIAFLASDALVHPASFDPFPTVVLQAMAWGKPVIGTDVCGTVIDRVEEGINGFIVPEGDIKALARAMDQIASDPQKRTEMGKRARQKAELYPVDLAFEKIENLYALAKTSPLG